MKLRSVLISSVLGAATITAPARTQGPAQPDTGRFGNPTSTARIYQNYLYGVVKKINSEDMVLEKTKFGIDQTFKFDRKTKFIHDGKPSSRDKVKEGDKVWVDVHKDKRTGDLIAKKVVTGVDVTSAR
jgi:hypothetical protein